MNEQIDVASEGIRYDDSDLRKFFEYVAWLASRGLSRRQIFEVYGLTEKEWITREKMYPELKVIIARAKNLQIADAGDKLLTLVSAGDFQATKFYLKTQGRWRDTTPITPPDEEVLDISDVSIETNDPVEAAKIYQKLMMGS